MNKLLYLAVPYDMQIITVIICYTSDEICVYAEVVLNCATYFTLLWIPCLSIGSLLANLAGDCDGTPYFAGLKGRV